MSRAFTVGGHRWCIYYYPGGRCQEDAGFISLHIGLYEQMETTADPVRAQFDFSLVDETDQQESARIHGNKIFEFRGYSLHGNDRFMTSEDLTKWRNRKDNDNSLFAIRCDVLVQNPTWNTSPFILVPPPDMPRNFTDFLLAGEGNDVVFRVGDESFPAHRCVLAARSKVFRASFFGPMKEGTSITAAAVQIDDMDAAVFKALLGFIYGDSLPVPTQDENEGVLLQHLLVAADRYDIPRLKAMCETKLCDHIKVSTVATIMALADQHGCDGLKKTCYQYLRCPANLNAVMATDGFDLLYRSYPALMKDMMLAMLRPK
ncbi:hypothetical protein ZWY2020_000107 [Hordeum vulgare]|nr:hypothetical protein ZWY2020_000107 [Hordeum vulgare]